MCAEIVLENGLRINEGKGRKQDGQREKLGCATFMTEAEFTGS